MKKARFIPISFIPHKDRDKHWLNAIDKIVKEDKVIVKDIVLPLLEERSTQEPLLNMIIDSLLTYILDGTTEDIFIPFLLSFHEGPYEYKCVRLEKGDIVIDAGANIGEFSALAGVKGCKAYAFEPIPNIINSYLSKTAKWNQNIMICQYALSDKIDELVFNEDFVNIVSSSFVREVNNSRKIIVKSIDLDTFVEQNKLSSVDFIKADIEGAERYMLMGAKRVLKEFSPKISICTYHLPDDPQVLRELILNANPNYVIEERFKKMYAYVPRG